MYLSPGFANEKFLYLATDLQKVENPRPQDEDEILELYELTIAEAKAEVAKGTICDAKTLQYWNCIYCRDSLRRTRNEQRSVSHSDRASQTQRSRRKEAERRQQEEQKLAEKRISEKKKKFRRFIVKKRKQNRSTSHE